AGNEGLSLPLDGGCGRGLALRLAIRPCACAAPHDPCYLRLGTRAPDRGPHRHRKIVVLQHERLACEGVCASALPMTAAAGAIVIVLVSVDFACFSPYAEQAAWSREHRRPQ